MTQHLKITALALPALLCLWLAWTLAPVQPALLLVFAALSGAAFWLRLAWMVWTAGRGRDTSPEEAVHAARALKRRALRMRLTGRAR